jgi:hypothetical protein
MDARFPALGTAYMQLPILKVDVVPTQRHQLAGAQTVAIGQQDRRSIPVPPAVVVDGIFSTSRSVR